ncbi:Elongator complex protein 5 [Dipodascopsis uninucleata]
MTSVPKPTQQHTTLLMKRLFLLKDYSPLILLRETIDQTAKYVLAEFAYQSRSVDDLKTIFLGFESIKSDLTYIENDKIEFISSYGESWKAITKRVSQLVSNHKKSLILIDSLTSLDLESVVPFISSLVHPSSTIVVINPCSVYGKKIPQKDQTLIPSVETQLNYLSTTVISVRRMPSNDDELRKDETDEDIAEFVLPIRSNMDSCIINFLHRRKSGRAIEANMMFSYRDHEVNLLTTGNESREGQKTDEDSVLKNLTTFNLGTTEKQKIARDNVVLPYLAAQQDDSAGGAIVYEFEAEDDYDEEDPYEDPF